MPKKSGLFRAAGAVETGEIKVKKKVMLVFGTRPEAIKMCPLVRELQGRTTFEVCVCVTGQHKEMLAQVLEVFQVKPDYDLAIMKKGQGLADITAEVLVKITAVYREWKPDIVLVHGDTSTAFAAALAAFYEEIPCGHVEAGLRTWRLDAPFPEEFNRQAVGLTARLHFAPTQTAGENLLREGKNEKNIFVTGNTAIDALKLTVRDSYNHPELEWAKDSRLLLLTAHRRENLGEPMHHMFRAIKRILGENKGVKVIYPIHLNPAVRQAARDVFTPEDRIHLIEPLDVLDFHNFMEKSYLILTDSGGIQEEAPALGKPVLVMRDTTERPEGVEAGTLRLIGTEEENVYRAISEILDCPEEYEKMSKANNPYGDGTASVKIADILERTIL